MPLRLGLKKDFRPYSLSILYARPQNGMQTDEHTFDRIVVLEQSLVNLFLISLHTLERSSSPQGHFTNRRPL